MSDFDKMLTEVKGYGKRADAALVKAEEEKVTTPSSRRALFKIDRNADLTRQTKETQARIKTFDAFIAGYRTMTLDPMLLGGKFKTVNGSYVKDPKTREHIFDLWPEGVWDVYSVRSVNYNLGPLLVALDEWGRVSDLKLMVPIAEQAVARMKDTGKGFRAYYDWDAGNFDRALDQWLITGPLACLDRALWVNRDEPEVPEGLAERMSLMMNEDIMKGLFWRSIDDYRQDGKRDARLKLWDELKAFRRFDGSDKAKKEGVLSFRQILDAYHKRGLYLDYDRWGHGLYHPAMSLHCAATVRGPQYGWPEDKAVAERSAKDILECRVLVDTPKGKMEFHPHFVPGRNNWVRQYASQKQDLADMGYVDITYPRESAVTEELAMRAGSNANTPELSGAFCRSFVWCGLSEGPRGKTIAATLGGAGPANLKGKKVISIRGGAQVLPGPYFATRPAPGPDSLDYISSARRGANCMGVRFADKATLAEVKLLNDHLPPSQQGNSIALALVESRRV